MKILLIPEHFPPHIGGVEIVFEEYAKRLSRRGHEVKVVTSNSGGIVGIRKTGGFEVHYIKCASFFGHPIIPRKEIEKIISWADIVHTTTYTAALPALKAAKRFKKPCILTVHEVLGKKWFLVEKNLVKALAFLLFERFVVKKDFTFWLTISQATQDDLLRCGLPKEKSKMIYLGIDHSIWNPQVVEKSLNDLLNSKEPSKFFLYNGRPGQTKGIFVLLEAIRKVKDRLSDEFKFAFIISKRPKKERKKFEKLVAKYKLSDSIRIADPLPYQDLPGFRRNAFAFISPSLTEGFGFTTAETCAIGVPVICSNAGSLPEVASGKVLFFKNGNPDDLAEKIILATEGKFENIPVKKFDWEEAIDRIEEVYRKIVCG